jgi:hypothetical protein
MITIQGLAEELSVPSEAVESYVNKLSRVDDARTVIDHVEPCYNSLGEHTGTDVFLTHGATSFLRELYAAGYWGQDEIVVPRGSDLLSIPGAIGYVPSFGDPDEGLTGGDETSLTHWRQCQIDDVPVLVTVPGTLWGDYVGSFVDRSNYRSLLRDYPDTFVIICSNPGAQELAVLGSGILPDGLQEELQQINDPNGCPVYDEDDLSFLELEMIDEAISEWAGYDLQQTVIGLLRGRLTDEQLDEITEESVVEEYRALVSEGVFIPEVESAVSTHIDIRGAASLIAERMLG